jgi:hypothetical protein
MLSLADVVSIHFLRWFPFFFKSFFRVWDFDDYAFISIDNKSILRYALGLNIKFTLFIWDRALCRIMRLFIVIIFIDFTWGFRKVLPIDFDLSNFLWRGTWDTLVDAWALVIMAADQITSVFRSMRVLSCLAIKKCWTRRVLWLLRFGLSHFNSANIHHFIQRTDTIFILFLFFNHSYWSFLNGSFWHPFLELFEICKAFSFWKFWEKLLIILVAVIILVQELLNQEIFSCSSTMVNGITQVWP